MKRYAEHSVEKRIFRVLCALLCGIYVLTAHGPNTVYANTPFSPVSPLDKGTELNGVLDYQPPPQTGRILKRFEGKRPLSVVLIQDAHGIPQAQENITTILAELVEKYGVRHIGVEGAAGPLDVTVFRSFPEEKILEKTLTSYARKGELAATTQAAIALAKHTSPPMFYGVENWHLYEKGLTRYLEAKERSEKVLSEKLKRLRERVEEEKKQKYSARLLTLDRHVRNLQYGGDLLSTLQLLASVKPPPPESDLAFLIQHAKLAHSPELVKTSEIRVLVADLRKSLTGDPLHHLNRLEQAFLTSRLSAGAFLFEIEQLAASQNLPFPALAPSLRRLLEIEHQLRAVQVPAFFQSLASYIAEVKNSLFRDEEEKRLDRLSHLLDLVERLSRLELTREEWQELETLLAISAREPFVDDLPVLEILTDGSFQLHLDFYQIAEEREKYFYRNLMEGLADNKTAPASARSAILVVGGFHAETLAARFEKEGISYVLLSPFISTLPEVASSYYEDHMRGKVSWRSYYRAQNGRVNLYDAFIRCLRDRIVEVVSQEPLGSGPYARWPGRLLKDWRDELVRDMARAGRIETAGRYTRFLDEVTGAKGDIFSPLGRIEKFIQGLYRLQARGAFTESNIQRLLEPATSADPTYAVLTHRPLKADLALGRIDRVRAKTRSYGLLPESLREQVREDFGAPESAAKDAARSLQAFPAEAGDIGRPEARSPVPWYSTAVTEGVDEQAVRRALMEMRRAWPSINYEIQEIREEYDEDVLFKESELSQEMIDRYLEAVRYFNGRLSDAIETPEALKKMFIELHHLLGGQGVIRKAGLIGDIQRQKTLDDIFRFMFTEKFNRLVKRNPVRAAAEIYTRLVNLQAFYDGNKRAASFILNYVLLKAGYNPFVLTRDNAALFRHIVFPIREDADVNVHEFYSFLSSQVQRRAEARGDERDILEAIKKAEIYTVEQRTSATEIEKSGESLTESQPRGESRNKLLNRIRSWRRSEVRKRETLGVKLLNFFRPGLYFGTALGGIKALTGAYASVGDGLIEFFLTVGWVSLFFVVAMHPLLTFRILFSMFGGKAPPSAGRPKMYDRMSRDRRLRGEREGDRYTVTAKKEISRSESRTAGDSPESIRERLTFKLFTGLAQDFRKMHKEEKEHFGYPVLSKKERDDLIAQWWEFFERYEDLDLEVMDILIAYLDDQPVAGFGFNVYPDFPDEVQDNGLYVNPDYRRQGIGLAVYEELIQYLKAKGYHKLKIGDPSGASSHVIPKTDEAQKLHESLLRRLNLEAQENVTRYPDGAIQSIVVDLTQYRPPQRERGRGEKKRDKYTHLWERVRQKLEELGTSLEIVLANFYHEEDPETGLPEIDPKWVKDLYQHATFASFELPTKAVSGYHEDPDEAIVAKKNPFWRKLLDAAFAKFRQTGKRAPLRTFGVDVSAEAAYAIDRMRLTYEDPVVSKAPNTLRIRLDKDLPLPLRLFGISSERASNVTIQLNELLSPHTGLRLTAQEREMLEERKVVLLERDTANPFRRQPVILYYPPHHTFRETFDRIREKYADRLRGLGLETKEEQNHFISHEFLTYAMIVERDATQIRMMAKKLLSYLRTGYAKNLKKPFQLIHSGGVYHYATLRGFLKDVVFSKSQGRLKAGTPVFEPRKHVPPSQRGSEFFASRRWEVLDHHEISPGSLQIDPDYYVALFDDFLRQADFWYSLGTYLLQKKYAPHAIMAFQKAASKHANDFMVLASLAAAYDATGQRDQAIASYHRVIDLNPSYAPAWMYLGNLYEKQRRSEEAIRHYRRAVGLDPTLDFAWYHLGFLLHKQDKYQEAVQAFQSGLEVVAALDPRDLAKEEAFWSRLSFAYERSGKTQASERIREEILRPREYPTREELENLFQELDQPQRSEVRSGSGKLAVEQNKRIARALVDAGRNYRDFRPTALQEVWQNPTAQSESVRLPLSRFVTAYDILKEVVRRTPLIRLDAISQRLGKPVFIKDESSQVAGSFKFRGVYFEVYEAVKQVLDTNPGLLKDGLKIVTQTDGNHGIAMIHAVTQIIRHFTSHANYAQYREDLLKMEPVVFALQNLPDVKHTALHAALAEYRQAIQNMGVPAEEAVQRGMVRAIYPSYEAAKEDRIRYIETLSPRALYMDHGGEAIMAGHGSSAYEIAEQLAALGIDDSKKVVIVVPVGAGGPLGIGLGLKSIRPNTSAVMVQSRPYGAFVRSLLAGEMTTNEAVPDPTFALNFTEGLEISFEGVAALEERLRRGEAIRKVVFEDGIAVDAPENEWTFRVAQEFLDAGMLVDARHAFFYAAPLLYADLVPFLGDGARVGGTTALTLEALLAPGEVLPDVLKDADAVVLFGTEGNVEPFITEYQRQRSQDLEELWGRVEKDHEEVVTYLLEHYHLERIHAALNFLHTGQDEFGAGASLVQDLKGQFSLEEASEIEEVLVKAIQRAAQPRRSEVRRSEKKNDRLEQAEVTYERVIDALLHPNRTKEEGEVAIARFVRVEVREVGLDVFAARLRHQAIEQVKDKDQSFSDPDAVKLLIERWTEKIVPTEDRHSQITVALELLEKDGRGSLDNYVRSLIHPDVRGRLEAVIFTGETGSVTADRLKQLQEAGIQVTTVANANRIGAGRLVSQKVLPLLRRTAGRHTTNPILLPVGVETGGSADPLLETAESVLQVVAAVLLAERVRKPEDLNNPELQAELLKDLFEDYRARGDVLHFGKDGSLTIQRTALKAYLEHIAQTAIDKSA